MMNCDYTNSTVHTFHSEVCEQCDNINYVGVSQPSALERALRCGPVSEQWVQFFVPKILDIPEQKPDMEGIVSVNSSIKIISQRVVNTPVVKGYTRPDGTVVPGEDIPNGECTHLTGKKLIIEGVILQKIIYTAAVPDQALHSATYTIPFSVFIIADKDVPLTQDYVLHPYLEDVYVCRLSERSVFSSNTLFIKAIPVC